MAFKYVIGSALVVVGQCSGACLAPGSEESLVLVQKHASMLQENDDSKDNSDGTTYEVSYSIKGFRTTGGCGNDWGTHSEYER